MPTRALILLFLFPLLVLGVMACSSSSSAPSPTGSSGTSGDSGTSGSSGTSGGTPKFRADVNPLLGASCALAACHGSSASNLGIYIPYDAAEAYASLQKQSPTAKMSFVVPGDPKNSYLQIKLDGTQGQIASKCGSTCGAQMPLDLPVLTQEKRDLIRAWIQAGAKND